MTYPNQPPYQPSNPQGAPGFGYAPQPGYAPPAPGYYPPQQPYYPPQQPPAGPEPVLARGTLEDYLDQPTAGGGAAVTKFFSQRPQGSWLQLRLTRDLVNSDVRQQTDANNVPQTYKSTGKPKFVLVLQVEVLQSSDGSHPTIFTEGVASVWLKGVTSDAFKQAMAAAGIINPDKALAKGKLGGAVITMQSAGEKPSGKPGFSPTKLYSFNYTPCGRELEEDAPAAPSQLPPTPAQSAPPVTAPVQQPPAPAQYAAPTAPPAQVSAPPTAPGYEQMTQPYPPAPGAPLPPTPPQQYAQQAPPPGYATPPAPQAPVAQQQAPTQGAPVPPSYAPQGQPQMDPEKAQLLARLQGQQG